MGAYLPIMQVNMIVRPDSAPPRLYDLIDHDNMYWFIYTARHARHDHHVLNVLPKGPPATLIQKACRSHVARACLAAASPSPWACMSGLASTPCSSAWGLTSLH